MITEGGWSLAANSSAQAAPDLARAYYFANYTSEVLRAIRVDGVDVAGYFAWSLMDNFEWEKGYSERFGVVFNDFRFGNDTNSPSGGWAGQPTAAGQTRTRKDSSRWLQAVWETNALVDPAALLRSGHKARKEEGVASDVFNAATVATAPPTTGEAGANKGPPKEEGAVGDSGLRCNTYLGTDHSSSGSGIETCVTATDCVMREQRVFGVVTYSMSCDDLFQCRGLPPNACCVKQNGLVVRCSHMKNFNDTRVSAESFADQACRAKCTVPAH